MEHEASDIPLDDSTTDEIVVHSLRQAGRIFNVAADTIAQWCKSGRLEGIKGEKTWTITIPADHPDLPANKVEQSIPHHYPRVEDGRDVELAQLRAERDRLLDEVTYLREQQRTYQQQLPEFVERMLLVHQKALPAPVEAPWWRRLWPW